MRYGAFDEIKKQIVKDFVGDYELEMKILQNMPKNPGVAIIYTNQHHVLEVLKKQNLDGAFMYRIEDILNFQDEHYKLEKINPVITEILVLNNNVFP